MGVNCYSRTLARTTTDSGSRSTALAEPEWPAEPFRYDETHSVLGEGICLGENLATLFALEGRTGLGALGELVGVRELGGRSLVKGSRRGWGGSVSGIHLRVRGRVISQSYDDASGLPRPDAQDTDSTDGRQPKSLQMSFSRTKLKLNMPRLALSDQC